MSGKLSRKKFLQTTGLATASILATPSWAAFNRASKIKAIAFDGFPIFDPRPVFKKVHELFPGKGKELVETWQAKQFGYQWLRVAAGQYKNFWQVTEDALDYAATKCNIQLSAENKNRLMNKYKELNTWPDVIPALTALKAQNLKISFLSNMTADMLNRGIDNSDTRRLFDEVISTDEQQTYKPHPAAYQMGVDKLKLPKEEILFVAFAGWDMAGAKWFGYPTYWVNRLHAPMDNLDAQPDGTGDNLNALVEFIKKANEE